MPVKEKLHNIPISMPSDFLAEIDAAAKEENETRSNIMRRAIRAGLPLVKSGGAADVLTLDGELSREVEVVAKQREENRNKVLLGAIRAGLYRLPPVQAANPQQNSAVDIIANLHSMTVGGALGLNEPGGEDRLREMLRPILMPLIVDEINVRIPALKSSKPREGK